MYFWKQWVTSPQVQACNSAQRFSVACVSAHWPGTILDPVDSTKALTLIDFEYFYYAAYDWALYQKNDDCAGEVY
jgi:hypothetical protein